MKKLLAEYALVKLAGISPAAILAVNVIKKLKTKS